MISALSSSVAVGSCDRSNLFSSTKILMKLVHVYRAAILLFAMAITAPDIARAQQREVTIAHLDMLLPLRTVMESRDIEKSTGYKINWRMFGSGADIIRAMASGDVQIAELGSSGMAVAMSQGQDIKLFWILDDSAESEGLIKPASYALRAA